MLKYRCEQKVIEMEHYDEKAIERLQNSEEALQSPHNLTKR